MSERVEVVIPAQDAPQPSLEELAAKMDEPTQTNSDEQNVDTGERPEWLPEKFKSPEDLAKAYSELEKKLGQQPPRQEQAPDDPPSQQEGEEGDDPAREAVENVGLDFDALSTEYWESGELSESSLASLEKAGIPKEIVQQYIAGQEALMAATEARVFDAVGGREQYSAMTEWAAQNLPEAEVQAYNAAVNSGDINAALMAAQGLKARYSAAEGFEPRVQVGGNAKPTSDVYESIAQVQADMSNPLYRSDPAFRQKVEQKLARSDVF